MHPNQVFKSSNHSIPQPASTWFAIFGFILLITFCSFAGANNVLNILFPISSIALGIILYSRSPTLYLGFTLWLWFLSPLLRRFVDYKIGFTEPSPILLAPFLVSLITLPNFLKDIPKFKHQGALPFVLSFLGVLYGLLIGCIKSSLLIAALSALEWLAPITLSYYLFANWQLYPQLCRMIRVVFSGAVLFTGIYGIFQYLTAPEWDRFWLINTGMTSAGIPQPLEIRVWSTMHSPGVFASVMMAGLLLLLNRTGPISLAATVVGYLSFLLSAVRAAWFGWFAGLVYLTVALKPKLQIRLVLIIFVTALVVVPLATVEPFSSVIGSRLQTFSDLGNDGSGLERQALYRRSMEHALTNLLGDGLNKAHSVDSAIITTLISLGWLGSIPYFSGLLLIFSHLIQFSRYSDPFSITARAIALGSFVQILFGTATLGLPGLMLWGFAALGLADEKYYLYEKSIFLRSANESEVTSSKASDMNSLK